MKNKTLSVSIPKECLSDFIRYQLNILLVQVIPTSEINTQVNVAWHVSLPAENKSYFWNDDSELYVSPVPNINGGVINSYSKRQCFRGQMLISEFNTFSPDANPVSHADYGVINKNVQGQLTFGMFKAISVDGQNALALPVNAVTVPRTYTALFTEPDSVYILLASNIVSSEIFYLPPSTENIMSMLSVEYGQCLALCLKSSMLTPLDTTLYFTDQDTNRIYSLATLLNFKDDTHIDVRYFPDLGKFVVTS